MLDGFPRTVAQAEALDAMLEEIGKPLDAVILLQVSDEVATDRLEARAAEEGRADDSPEAIRNRLRLYHELTEPSSIATGSPGSRSSWTVSRRWTRSSPTSRTRSQAWRASR